MKMYKDSSLTIPALCPLRGMAQCVSECSFTTELSVDGAWCCELAPDNYVLLYPALSDEQRGVDGRE